MRLPTLLILSAAALLVGCGEETNEQGPPPAVLGIESDRLGLPLLREAAGRFEQEDRRGRVQATAADDDEAFNRFCSADPRLDAVVVTRGITDDERRRCLDTGVLSRELPLAHAAVAFARSERLPLGCLSTAQLRRLLRARSPIETYADLQASLPRFPVRVFGPPVGTGEFDLIRTGILGADSRVRRDYGRVTPGVFEQAFQGDGPAVGALGFREAVRAVPRERLIAVDGGRGCVAPSPASVQSNRYAPLSKLLRIYVSLDAIRRPALRRFLDLLVDRRAALADAGGLVPLSEAEARRAREVLRMRPPPEAEPRRSGG
jgi:phosphate transport system substrate-binding protein